MQMQQAGKNCSDCSSFRLLGFGFRKHEGVVLLLILLGIVLGVLSSVGLSRVVAGFLWGVTPTDPATLAIVVTILLGVALAASWIPASEAARLDPLDALTCE